MAERMPFFIIDEDKSNTVALKKIIRKIIPDSVVYFAEDGYYAWEFIQKQQKPMIIICDINIPGINGEQVLKKVRSFQPAEESYFILTVPEKFPQKELLQITLSGVDAFIRLPFAIEELVTNIRTGIKIIKKENTITQKNSEISSLNEELYKNTKQFKEMLFKIQKLRFSYKDEFYDNLAKAAQWILFELDENTEENIANDIGDAASLIHIGKLFLNDKMINNTVMSGGFARNEIMERVPKFAGELISDLKALDNVREILLHLYENYDGSGIPDKIQGWEIPLGSRILRVVLDFEDLLASAKKPMSKIIEMLDHESKRIYDFRCVTLLDQYLAASKRDKTISEIEIEPLHLKPGQTISRNIVTESGLKLISAGTLLRTEQIEKIQSIVAADPVIGSIWIHIK